MAEQRTPWDDIEPAGSSDELNRRRADPSHPLDFWYARDISAKYVFFLESPSASPSSGDQPEISGITLKIADFGATGCRLILTLNDDELLDLFGTLCNDLLEATRHLARRDPSGIAVVFARLSRWQELLRRAQSDLLSNSKIVGLIGELLILRDIVLPRLSALDAVMSWRGPYGDEQDFLLAGRIIEAKTQLSTSDQFLNISSETQLDTSSGPIMVCHQTVYVPSTEEAGAASLNAIAADIENRLAGESYQARHLFLHGLLEAGFRSREEYDSPLWQLNARTFLEVREGFPRLSASDLAEGIDRVRYRISVEACRDFELQNDDAMNWIFNE